MTDRSAASDNACEHTAKDRDNRRLHQATPQSVCTRCGALFTYYKDSPTTVTMQR